MEKSDFENKQFLKEILVMFHYAYHSTLPSFYFLVSFQQENGFVIIARIIQ